MNRRSFIGRVIGAALAVALSRLLPGIAADPPVVPPAPVVELLSRGDIITIDGVYATHPTSGETLPYLQTFIVVEDAITTEEPLALHPPFARQVPAVVENQP